MHKGRITQIQSMSLHDGPGIRITIFMKGCNMRCVWCHNPETWNAEPQVQFLADKCIECKSCFKLCRDKDFSPVQLTYSNTFSLSDQNAIIESCFTGALEMIGRDISVAEALKEIEKDREYFDESGGGITISGGEPCLQSDFVHDLLGECKKRGIHTAVETNVHVQPDTLGKLSKLVDLFMIDIKLWNSEIHKKWTGVENGLILENIKYLDGLGKQMIIRTPVVPGVNDNIEELLPIAEFVNSLKNVVYYELLPYHSLGSGKYIALGMENEMPVFPQLSTDRFNQLVNAVSLKCEKVKKN